MLEILSQVNEWLGQSKPVALATVIETWGSAPRRVASKMAVTEDLAMVGSVSGGCVETAVVEEALGSLKRNQAIILHYGVSDDDAWEVGLACGGKISILVEPLDMHWWQLATQAVERDETLITVTIIEGDLAGAKIALNAASEVVYSKHQFSPEQLQKIIDSPIPTKSGKATLGGYAVMVDVIMPRPHLVMIGGVHIAMALQHYAKMLGFKVTLIDPRDVFASDQRFPDVDCIFRAYPDKVLAQLNMTTNTYITVLTHDPKIDDPALKAALASKPAYIGVLSSKRTHEKRMARLIEAGIPENDIARLSTPIGLAIGAETPEEIALSVMAEIVAVKNKKIE